jgi:voltage-gated sodium channel
MIRPVHLSRQLAKARAFEYTIIGVIIANSVLLGLETSSFMAQRFGDWMHLGNQVALGIFIVEALVKMTAAAPRVTNYFRDGWNVFDFLIIVFALVPATGQFAMIARLARLLRVLRLISAVKELRLIITALLRSIPSVGHVMMLMSIIIYIYAIVGFHLFHEHDPANWRTLGISLLTLFNIITLEGWTDVMQKAMQWHPLSWIYFVSFVIVGTFVVINLFIAIIINNLDEAKQERLAQLEQLQYRDTLLDEIRSTQQSLRRLEEQLRQRTDAAPSAPSRGEDDA